MKPKVWIENDPTQLVPEQPPEPTPAPATLPTEAEAVGSASDPAPSPEQDTPSVEAVATANTTPEAAVAPLGEEFDTATILWLVYLAGLLVSVLLIGRRRRNNEAD